MPEWRIEGKHHQYSWVGIRHAGNHIHPVLVQANVSLYNLVLPGTRSLTQVSLRLTVTYPPQPPKCWGYRNELSHSTSILWLFPKGISTNCIFDLEAHHGVLEIAKQNRVKRAPPSRRQIPCTCCLATAHTMEYERYSLQVNGHHFSHNPIRRQNSYHLLELKF